MLKAIPEPRPTVNKYAPKMLNYKVPVDKIRELSVQAVRLYRSSAQTSRLRLTLMKKVMYSSAVRILKRLRTA